MAEGFVAEAIANQGLGHTVSSAGFLYDGRPVDSKAAKAAGRLGVDIDAHRSTKLAPEVVERADVILTMEREHTRNLLSQFKDQEPVVFPLRMFLDAARATPRAGDQSAVEYVAALAAARNPASLLGVGSTDDVADPIGKSMRTFRRSAEEIKHLCIAATAAIGPA